MESQTIESAPANTDLLVWDEQLGICFGRDDYGTWSIIDKDGYQDGHAEPTHWLALPKAPE